MQCSEVSIEFVEGGQDQKDTRERLQLFADYIRDQCVGRGEIVDYRTDTFAANTVICNVSNKGINCRKDTQGLF